MSQVLYRYGTWDQFSALTAKNENTLYFITDRRCIYKGDKLYGSNDAEFVTTVPEFDTAEARKIYVVTSADGVTLYVKGETKMEIAGGGKVRPGAISDINAFDESLLAKGTEGENNKLTTSDYVSEAIANAVAAYDGAFVDVAAAQAEDKSGTVLTFTTKKGETKAVTIADLFLTAATYDPVAHKLQLTVQGGDVVEVDLSALVPQAISTKDVAIAEKIVVTTDVGNLKKGDEIDPTSTADLQALLVSMLSQDSNPVATQPSASITLTGAGAKEVGTTFTPAYSAALNVGKYVANGKTQASGVSATAYAVTDTNAATSDTQTGTFGEFTVMDDTNYGVSVVITHTQGDMPLTFLGKEYPAARIAEGTKSASSAKVTGYRQGFYGALTSKAGELTSNLVRGLSGKTNKKVAKGQTYTISVPAGTLRIVLAYEASVGAVSSITSAEEFGSEIKDSFVLSTIDVNSASGDNAKSYNVYVKDLAGAQENATTYTVKI